MTYDYFIAGRTRNREQILHVAEVLRAAGKSVYCFLDQEYVSDKFSFSKDTDPEETMKAYEAVQDWRNDPVFQKIYKTDMDGLKASKNFLVVFPAGLSAHMELGAAFGMGKPCYSIGEFEKPESLYLMLDSNFTTVEEFLEGRR
jgi:hypothetical protein